MSRLSLPSAAALPLELRKELSQLDLRLRWVSFVKGMGSLLFVVLLLAALFLGIDFFIPLPGPIRFVFLALLWVASQHSAAAAAGRKSALPLPAGRELVLSTLVDGDVEIRLN